MSTREDRDRMIRRVEYETVRCRAMVDGVVVATLRRAGVLGGSWDATDPAGVHRGYYKTRREAVAAVLAAND